MQDLAVVGMGLIGSAALRHAAATSSVVGIGPAEPTEWSGHGGPFASHYDSGRVTRRLDARLEWAVLASRAIAQYPVIEERSEISFHRPSGLVFVRSDQPGLEKLRSVASALDIPIDEGPAGRAVAERVGLSFPESATVIAEPGPAGVIDPRAMIAAQHRAAKRDNALVARDAVISVRPSLNGFELLTVAGRTHQARNVLLTTGAYANQLLPDPLAMAVRPEVVVMGQVDEGQAEALADMPSIIHLLDHPDLDDVYINPPMRYPDGTSYIKIGGSHQQAMVMDGPEAMNTWMSQEAPAVSLDLLRDVLVSVLPEVTFTGWQAKPCLVTDTPSGLPYIDRLDNGVTVAVAGNGHAAKSADAIGALAAALAVTGEWHDEELPAALFKAQFGGYQPPPGSRHGN